MKAKIVMLETTDKSNIVKVLEDTISYTTTSNIPGGKFQHFYLIDPNVEIKIGDYQYDYSLNEISINIGQGVSDAKIIATTDKALIYKCECCNGTGIIEGEPCRTCIGGDTGKLPQLSKQSIKLLIDYYNKNDKLPDEVEVEDEKLYSFEAADEFDEMGYCGNRIKLNPQGEVDITISEVLYKNSEGINHLKWIYDRLINVHKENPNYDYMRKLKAISEEKMLNH
jgi:hypothetical protein